MADNVNRLLIVDEDGALADFIGKVACNVGYTLVSAKSCAIVVELRDQGLDPAPLAAAEVARAALRLDEQLPQQRQYVDCHGC